MAKRLERVDLLTIELVTVGAVDRHGEPAAPAWGCNPSPARLAAQGAGTPGRGFVGVFFAPDFGDVPILAGHDAASASSTRPSATSRYFVRASDSVLPGGNDLITSCNAWATASSASRARSRAVADSASARLIASTIAASARVRNLITPPDIMRLRWRARSDQERRRRRYSS